MCPNELFFIGAYWSNLLKGLFIIELESKRKKQANDVFGLIFIFIHQIDQIQGVGQKCCMYVFFIRCLLHLLSLDFFSVTFETLTLTFK